ncbi:TPA: hypothetical protein ACVG9G_006300 [Bacillus thuringiensis]
MEDYKCRACGEIAAEGFALGRLCYYCIEEVVIHMKKQIGVTIHAHQLKNIHYPQVQKNVISLKQDYCLGEITLLR